MSLLPEIEPLELLPDETLVFEWFVSHLQGASPMRGRLVLTNRRLAFRPTKMGALLTTLSVVAAMPNPSGKEWLTWLGDIADFSLGEETEQMFEKARPLQITQRWGLPDESFFVLTSLDLLEPKLREALANVDPVIDAQRERWSISANSVQRGTAVGGKLSLVGTSLVFLPSSFEKSLDTLVGSAFQPILSFLGRDVPTEAREIPLADIASIGKREAELSLEAARAGGLRDRLVLTQKSGGEEIFVVSDLDETISRLERCLASTAR